MGRSIARQNPLRSGAGSKAARAVAVSAGLACLWWSGCGAKYAESYRILGDPAKPVLAPPGVTKLHGNQKQFVVRPTRRKPDCPSPGRGINLRVRRNTVKISIRKEALEASRPGWLARWADTLSDRGCLPHDGRGVLVRRIVEAFPLGVGDTYRIPYGHPSIADSIDIVPGQKLKVVGPVLRDDSEPLELTVEPRNPNDGGGLILQARSSAISWDTKRAGTRSRLPETGTYVSSTI